MLGANRSLIILIEHLLKYDNVFIHVVLPAGGDMESKLKSLKISTEIIPFRYSYSSINLNWKGKLIEAINLGIDYLRLFFIANKFKNFDIISSNSSVISHGLILSRLLNIKHVWHIREYGKEDYNIEPTFGMRAQSFLARKSERLIFISEHLKNAKKSWFKNSRNAPVVYNGVPISEANQITPKNIENCSINICFAGLMTEKKNAIEGLDLIEELKAENIDSTLFIFAKMEGVYAEKFMDQIENRGLNSYVRIVGFVDDLCGAIKDCHFLLMPSRNEAMGRVSIEAMSMGIPVIGYNSGGTAELFIDGVSGIYYKEVTHIARKIKSMNNKQYQDMCHKARETAIDRYSKEKYGKNIYEVYRELASQS